MTRPNQRGTNGPGPITKALMDAVEMRRKLLDDGTPEHEVNRLVGQGLKALLQNPREAPWRFYCAHCRDTGWLNIKPSPEEAARLTHLYGTDVANHGDYVRRCDPCNWLRMEREKRKAQRGDDGFGDEDFASAGQVKPQRKWSKVGGR